MSDEVWYWREGSTQHGPITWEKLQSLAESGKIAPNDWVTRAGWIEWKRGLTVIVGAFIIFGAVTIVAGIRSLAGG